MTDRLEPTGDAPRPRPAQAGSIVDMREAPAPKAGGTAVSAAPPAESTLVGGAEGLPPMAPRKPLAPDAGTVGGADRKADTAGPGVTVAAAPPTPPRAAGPDRDAGADDRPAPTAPVTRPAPPQTSTAQPGTSQPVPSRPAPAARRGGFAPLFLGGMVAAAMGAGAAWWAIPRLPAAWQPVTAGAPVVDRAELAEIAATAARTELDTRTAALDTRAADAGAEAARAIAAEAASRAAGAGVSTQSLLDQARQAGSDAAARLIAEAPASAAPDASVAASLAAQAQQIADLDRRLAGLAQSPAAPAPAIDLAPIQQRIEALEQRPALDRDTAQRLDQLAADAAAATGRIDQAAGQAETRLREAESHAAELAAAADDAVRRARAAAAATALGEAVQTGAPREPALSQLKDAGVQPPAALTAEIPSLDSLAAEFPPAARAALRADLRSGAASGTGSIVGNFLRAQTGARSVTPRSGTDSDAVLSRAQAAVQRGAIADALTELDTLPPPARPVMAAWIDRARAYAQAQDALAALTGAEEPAQGSSQPPAQADAPQPSPAAGAAPLPGREPTPQPEGAASAPANSSN